MKDESLNHGCVELINLCFPFIAAALIPHPFGLQRR